MAAKKNEQAHLHSPFRAERRQGTSGPAAVAAAVQQHRRGRG